jgi:hypothetical protein
MKKALKIVGIVVVLLVTLCSCTNEPIEQVQFLKKIVEVSVDGTSNTTVLNYDGNKIVNIDKADKFLKFYYTDDLITKIVALDKTSDQVNTLDYLYSEGELIKISSSDNYAINYIHNSDGSVSYEKVTKGSNNLEVKIYHGILYFQNENLVKDERTSDDSGNGVLAKTISSIAYDSKNNALKNILGFNKLLDYSKIISSNNEILSTAVSSVNYIDDNQVVSEIKRFDSKYEYNTDGYPTEIVSQNIMFGSADSKHLKSQLFYN